MGYLDNVPEDKAFILGDRRLLNLGELQDALESMSDEEYLKFAGSDYNYFADWVYYVVGDSDLADAMKAAGQRSEAAKALQKAVKRLSSTKDILEQKVEFTEPTHKEADEKKDNVNERLPVDDPDKIEDVEHLMKKIARNENEIKDILWKHFAWDLAKEFMYGMAVGILIGFILSRILLR